MRRIIVGTIFVLFVVDLIYRNFYEKKSKPHSQTNIISQSNNEVKEQPFKETKQKDYSIESEATELSKEEEEEEESKSEPIRHRKIKTREEEDEFEGELPEDLPIDKIKIIYCKSSHEKYYETLSSSITGNYTSIKVTGEHYPIPKEKQLTVNILMVSQVILTLFIFGSDYVKPYLPFIPEFAFSILSTSRILFAASCYLFHTYFIQRAKATGAFEVYANNKIIWSKLNRHVLPTYDDIIEFLIRDD